MFPHYSPKHSANYRQASVLVIDDNADHWSIMRSVLEHVLPQANSFWVPDANSALAHLEECLSRGCILPKLILLDLYLPKREHGQQLLRMLKAHPSFHRLPIIVLSYSDNPQDIKDMYQEGTNSYIVKPTEYGQWLGCFQTLKTYWWDAVTLPGNYGN